MFGPNGRHIRRILKEKDKPIVLTNIMGSGIYDLNDLSLFAFFVFSIFYGFRSCKVILINGQLASETLAYVTRNITKALDKTM